MLAKRIIPCLDVRDGKVVKGVRFTNHQVVGEIVELARWYEEQGADEVVLYDIAASADARGVRLAWVEDVARELSIPFCVAGGIDCVERAEAVLRCGADKISVNSPALARPELINELAGAFGNQCVVIGIDAWRNKDGGASVKRLTGRDETRSDSGRGVMTWIDEVQQRGAGEIVLNVMRSDGTKQGYDIELLNEARERCQVPLIASGGAGNSQHFVEVFQKANVDGALAASVFHSREILIPDLRESLRTAGINVRVAFTPVVDGGPV